MPKKKLYYTEVRSSDFSSTADFFSKIKDFVADYEHANGHESPLVFMAELYTFTDDYGNEV